jgi:hypothetical protein
MATYTVEVVWSCSCGRGGRLPFGTPEPDEAAMGALLTTHSDHELVTELVQHVWVERSP